MIGKFLIISLFIIELFGSVSVKVDKQNVIEGDSVSFSIIATGSQVEFPKIKSIGGNKIEAISNSQNISIINGKYKKTITKTYVFTPTHSLVIPSFVVMVDNQVYNTRPIQIKVFKDTKTDKDFKIQIITNKDGIVGYPHLVTIKFYQKTNVKIGSVGLELPKGNFELKQIGKEKDYFDGVYQVAQLNYLLIPKTTKKIDFVVKLKLGFVTQQVDPFGFIMNGMRYKNLITSKEIFPKKLYNGVIGDFNISMKVDKTKVNANQPVNAELTISGYGDLSNLGEIKVDIPNTTIYDNKAKVKMVIKNNQIYSVYKKKYVIIADANYTIPSMSLSFYNPKIKKVETIKTKSIDIDVKQIRHQMTLNTNNQKIESNQTEQQLVNIKKYKRIDYFYLLVVFLVGVMIGYLLRLINLKKGILLPNNLYASLLPYADNDKIKSILNKLYDKKRLTKEEKKFIKEFLKIKKEKK